MKTAGMKFGDRMLAEVLKRAPLGSGIKIFSEWDFALIRSGKVVDTWHERNIVTDEGLTALLDIMFSDGSQIGSWYIGLSESNTTPAAAMTYAVPTFTECTAYDEGAREEFVEPGVATKAITNSASKAEFTISDTKTIYGAFLCGGGSAPYTKGDVAGGGTLFCFSLFSASKPVVDDDILQVTCTINVADA